MTGFSYFDRNIPSIAVHSLFDKYDTKRDGKLDQKEMNEFLQEALGLDFHASQIYFLLLDKDGDQGVSYAEFKDWLRSEERFQRLHDRSKFRNICTAYRYFKNFDTDNSDTLSREQFANMMKFLGYGDVDMDGAFARMNRHQNQRLSFWEFMIWLNWAPVE